MFCFTAAWPSKSLPLLCLTFRSHALAMTCFTMPLLALISTKLLDAVPMPFIAAQYLCIAGHCSTTDCFACAMQNRVMPCRCCATRGCAFLCLCYAFIAVVVLHRAKQRHSIAHNCSLLLCQCVVKPSTLCPCIVMRFYGSLYRAFATPHSTPPLLFFSKLLNAPPWLCRTHLCCTQPLLLDAVSCRCCAVNGYSSPWRYFTKLRPASAELDVAMQ